jgi:predicted P-loop ATPase
MLMIARAHPYHPVRDWLATLVWDGVPRIDGVLARYCGAAASPINRAIGRKWMLGAVSRVMVPGGQMDTTLILVGRQGAGKSSFFRAMVPRPEWFSDTAMDLGSKDAFQQLSGIWIYEVAELSALRARDAEAVKAFLTARADRYRPPYGRNVVRIDRQVVFVGTTNEAEFLDDPTGARRFWPVEAGAFDLDALAADRDQLWAEAFEIFTTANEEARQWHLTPEESAMLAEHHTRYARSDTWRDALDGWLSGVKLANARVSGITVEEALTGGLDLQPRDQHRGNSMRVASLLASMGWTKRKTLNAGQRAWRWFPPD